MAGNDKTVKTFLQLVAPWIKGCQISVYVHGREKPLTGVTVCAVFPGVLIGRWSNSTHLIPLDAITYIRFMPDCDPCRQPPHPLHDTVATNRPGDRRGFTPAKPYRFERRDTIPVGEIINDMMHGEEKQKNEPPSNPQD